MLLTPSVAQACSAHQTSRRARSGAVGEDANPTLALLATATFLRANRHPFQLTQDEAFDLIMGVAEGTLDVPDIAVRPHSDGE